MTSMSYENGAFRRYKIPAPYDSVKPQKRSVHKVVYCSEVFEDDLSPIIDAAEYHLAGYIYDTLVGTGLSGTLIVPVLGRAFKKNWMIVRRRNEDCHSDKPVAGSMGDNWVFVDDIFSTGKTFDYVYETIKDFFDCNYEGVFAEYVASYFYSGNVGSGEVIVNEYPEFDEYL